MNASRQMAPPHAQQHKTARSTTHPDPRARHQAATGDTASRETECQAVEQAARPHPDKPLRFKRARPNRLWQTDMFTFVMKRQNRRVYLVVYMDDHSRFVVGWGLFSSPSTEMVIEALKAALESFKAPEELLTDNGPQYVTRRGKSRFAVVCTQRGIRQIVSHPRRPQTLGKVEGFWATLWRGMLKTAIFSDAADARRQIGEFVDQYNFERPHREIGGLRPADRYFGRMTAHITKGGN